MTMIEIRQFMAWMKESEVKWIYLCVTMTQCANMVVIFSNGISFGLKYARLTRGHVINHNKKSAEVSVACYHFRALHVMNFFFFLVFTSMSSRILFWDPNSTKSFVLFIEAPKSQDLCKCREKISIADNYKQINYSTGDGNGVDRFGENNYDDELYTTIHRQELT